MAVFRGFGKKQPLPQTVYETQTFDEIQRHQIMNFVKKEFENIDYLCPTNFDTDWSDGIAFIRMLEYLTGKRIARYCRHPRLPIQRIDNINIAVNFLETHYKMKVFGCSPKDIEMGNEKQVTGILFILMNRVRRERANANSTKKGWLWRRFGRRGDWRRSRGEDFFEEGELTKEMEKEEEDGGGTRKEEGETKEETKKKKESKDKIEKKKDTLRLKKKASSKGSNIFNSPSTSQLSPPPSSSSSSTISSIGPTRTMSPVSTSGGSGGGSANSPPPLASSSSSLSPSAPLASVSPPPSTSPPLPLPSSPSSPLPSHPHLPSHPLAAHSSPVRAIKLPEKKVTISRDFPSKDEDELRGSKGKRKKRSLSFTDRSKIISSSSSSLLSPLGSPPPSPPLPSFISSPFVSTDDLVNRPEKEKEKEKGEGEGEKEKEKEKEKERESLKEREKLARKRKLGRTKSKGKRPMSLHETPTSSFTSSSSPSPPSSSSLSGELKPPSKKKIEKKREKSQLSLEIVHRNVNGMEGKEEEAKKSQKEVSVEEEEGKGREEEREGTTVEVQKEKEKEKEKEKQDGEGKGGSGEESKKKKELKSGTLARNERKYLRSSAGGRAKRLSLMGSFSLFGGVNRIEALDKKMLESTKEGLWEIDGFSDDDDDEEEDDDDDDSDFDDDESDDEEDKGGENEVSVPREKEGPIDKETFIQKWNEIYREKRDQRLNYLYDKFTGDPQSAKALEVLQAVVRRMLIQRAYLQKIDRRNMIANEILNTERSYFKGLQTMLKVFQEPLTAQKTIPLDDIRAIFSFSSAILKTSESLLLDLEERMGKWYTEGQRIGDIFLKFVAIFKIYTDYVNNYNISVDLINSLKKKNREFRSILNEGMKKCHGHDLNSYLVLPIQRIPRYVMLLEEMYKFTPADHPDFTPLQKVVVDIRGVAKYVNERKRAAENQLQVARCSDQITGIEFSLVTPSRRYTHEGFLSERPFDKKAARERYMFCFNDLFMITSLPKQKKGNEKGGTVGAGGKIERPAIPGSLGERGSRVDKSGGAGGAGGAGGGGGGGVGGRVDKSGVAGSRVRMGGTGTVTGGMLDGAIDLFCFSHCVDFQNIELGDLDEDDEKEKEEKEKSGVRWKRGRVVPEFGFYLRKIPQSTTKFNFCYYAEDYKSKLMWMNALDRAISETIDCDASRLGVLTGVEERAGIKFQKQGVLRVMGSTGHWRERLIKLANGILEVYTIRKEKEGILKDRLMLGGCTARVMEVSDREYCFQVTSSQRILILSSETNAVRFEWLNGIRESLRGIMSYQEKLKENPGLMIKELIVNVEGNNRCADCGEQEIQWGNLTAGVFVCKVCGGIHRSLTHNMKLKPIGRGKWTLEDVAVMKQKGNKKVNLELEGQMDPEIQKIVENDSHSQKCEFIESKYRHLLPEDYERSSPLSSRKDNPPPSSSSSSTSVFSSPIFLTRALPSPRRHTTSSTVSPRRHTTSLVPSPKASRNSSYSPSPSLSPSPSPSLSPPSSSPSPPSPSIIHSTHSTPNQPSFSFSPKQKRTQSQRARSPFADKKLFKSALTLAPISPRKTGSEIRKVENVSTDARGCLMEMKKDDEWVLHFVTLKKNRLKFQDTKRPQMIGEIVLDLATTVLCELNSEKPHTFRIATLTRNYIFAVPNEDELMAWIDLITKNSVQSRKKNKKKKRRHASP